MGGKYPMNQFPLIYRRGISSFYKTNSQKYLIFLSYIFQIQGYKIKVLGNNESIGSEDEHGKVLSNLKSD